MKRLRWPALMLLAPMAWLALHIALSEKPELQPGSKSSVAYYSSDAELLRLTLAQNGQYRLWIALDDIPESLQQATLLYEDRAFYSHIGVNPLALVRATWQSYVSSSRRFGASTITMQLARLRYRLHTRTITGKLHQIVIALQIERHHSKQAILEAYLNLAPYGQNVEGIGAASLVYFHKPANMLSTAECLLLSVVPQNPNKRAPGTQSGYANAVKARDRLLTQWQQATNATNEQTAGLSLPLLVHPISALPFKAPHFINALMGNSSRSFSPIVNTSVSAGLQRRIEAIMRKFVNSRKSTGISNAAAMVLDYRDMQVKAELGSVDYFDASIQGQVNGTRALRSPGSTLKPFIYALAMQQGLIHPGSILKDTPKRFAAYTPENYDARFAGPISATQALVRSRNIPAVSLLQQLESPSFHQWLSTTNPQRLASASHYGLALALGGNEVSMLELVQLYATLANHGRFQQAVELDNAGTPASQPHTMELLSPEASFLALDMLAQNPATDSDPDLQKFRTTTAESPVIAWKTGTSFAYRDAWAIGIVGNHVVAVWVGNFNGSANPAFVGRKSAAPLFFSIARSLQREHTAKAQWQVRDTLDISKEEICTSTGELQLAHCPQTHLGWFIPGVSPIASQHIYREVLIDAASGLRACDPHAKNTLTEVFAFWPTDIQAAFTQAGIHVNTAPAWLPECNYADPGAAVDKPVITSPMASLDYALQSSDMDKERIPFSAITRNDSQVLYWFVSNRFVGKANAGEVFLWKPAPGNHTVTVMDDVGRSSKTGFRTVVVN